jgi:hypothetical protein
MTHLRCIVKNGTDRSTRSGINTSSYPINAICARFAAFQHGRVAATHASSSSLCTTAMKSLHHLRLASPAPLWIFSGHDAQWNILLSPRPWFHTARVCVCVFFTFNTQHHAGSHASNQLQVGSLHLNPALHNRWKYCAIQRILILLVPIGIDYLYTSLYRLQLQKSCRYSSPPLLAQQPKAYQNLLILWDF